MYPLLLKPVIKNYIWGKDRLIREYGYESDLTPVAEAWVLSCRDGDENTVTNGEYKGRRLSDVPWIKKDGFPVLVKLIDAANDLSVQVHPSEECAAKHGDEAKTEMWYVLDCDEGASLILGFNEEFEKEKKRLGADDFARTVREYAENGKIMEICRRVDVHPGDVFFVEPGTLHAICRGILIAEIQQNSDTTYRVYDYGRLGADGKPRELHIERAIDACLMSETGRLEKVDLDVPTPFGDVRVMSVGKVSASVVTMDGDASPEGGSTYHVLVLDGEGRLSWNDGSIDIKKGDSVVIPGGLAHTISGKLRLLTCNLDD